MKKYWLYITAVFLILIIGLINNVNAGTVVDDTRIVINIPARVLWLYSGETLIKSYPVGVGRVDFPTPGGEFKVISKVVNPGWENPFKSPGKNRIAPGNKSPLGTRWIGFLEADGGEYGIHGTNVPSSVGKFSSHGCVRMQIEDAEELFDNIAIGTPVEVSYDSALITLEDDQIKIRMFPDWFGKGIPTLSALKQKILKQFPDVNIDENHIAQAVNDFSGKSKVVGKTVPVNIQENAAVTFKIRISN